MKESQHLQDTKDRQIQELRQMVEETNTTKKHEFEKKVGNCNTLMILSFWTDMSEQAVQTQIRLLLEEQSDQGLHCLPFFQFLS